MSVVQPSLGAWLEPLAAREARIFRLGRLRLRVESNVLPLLSTYLHPRHAVMDEAADWRAAFVLARPEALSEALKGARARGYRSERLYAGHYLGHHWGPPVLELRSGARERAYIGEQVERVFWCFFLKYVLTAHHLPAGVLHLKAAAVEVGARGWLLLGRGGAGKTHAALALCRRGARLVSNTHCLLDGLRVYGLSTAVRLRAQDGERLVPAEKVPVRWADATVVRGLVFLDGRARAAAFQPLAAPEAFAFALEFAAAVNNYDLKEDLADDAGDVAASAALFRREAELLRALVERVPCLTARLDLNRDDHLAEFEGALQHWPEP